MARRKKQRTRGKKKKLRWTREANDELLSILQFYIERNKSVSYSSKLKWRINERLNLIRSFPCSGQPTSDETARVVVVDNFVLLFEFDATDDCIVVKAIRDGRRDLDFLNTGENDVNDGID